MKYNLNVSFLKGDLPLEDCSERTDYCYGKTYTISPKSIDPRNAYGNPQLDADFRFYPKFHDPLTVTNTDDEDVDPTITGILYSSNNTYEENILCCAVFYAMSPISFIGQRHDWLSAHWDKFTQFHNDGIEKIYEKIRSIAIDPQFDKMLRKKLNKIKWELHIPNSPKGEKYAL